MIVYYNPECSKCHATMQLLEENNCKFEIRNYLQQPPSVKELRALVKLLNCSPLDITRTKDPLFMEKYSGEKPDDEELYHFLSANPILIERPIVIDGQRAIIGRPPELVIELLNR